MTRVKIKCKGDPDRGRKIKLLEVLCTNEIHVTKIFNTPDGFALLLLNEDNADKIFSKKIKENLEKVDFSPILPPELKVKKSVIATSLDDLIYERDEDQIKEELIKSNDWIEDVDSVYKFPKSSTIKITFTQTALAKKCTQIGFLAFSISHPSYNVKQETYIPIKCCMKCYQLEDHATRECHMPKDYKICSECSEEGHVWHQCKGKNKCCINCCGDHSTLAMRCSKRKEILKNKRKEEAERNKLTYAGAIQNTATQPILGSQIQQCNQPLINREDALKINICVAHAHHKNIENPGCYEEELNKILALNNLPNIKVPNDTNSRKNTSSRNAQATRTNQIAPETKLRKSKGGKDTAEQGKIDSEAINKVLEEMEEEILPKEAKEIGLQFYTTEEKGWPQKNFTIETLITGIQNNKFKFTYTDNKFTEEQVLNMIKGGEFLLRECWNQVEKDTFRKIRSGIIQERSPINERDPRHRRTSYHD